MKGTAGALGRGFWDARYGALSRADALERTAGPDPELREVRHDAANGPAWVERSSVWGPVGRIIGDEIA